MTDSRASYDDPLIETAGVTMHNLSRAEFFAGFARGAVYPVNVDVIMKARRDAEFMAVLRRAELRVCDSQIILLAARFLGTPFKEKISGSDALGEFCAYHRDDASVRVFLLGARPGVAAEAARRINARVGRPIVVGSHSPSFGFDQRPEECAKLARVVEDSGATVLVVGVGAPRQEKFIDRYRALMPGVTRFIAVGATLDFEAGNLERAPAWMSRAGLEWFFRFSREPRRLWRRYFLENPPYLWLVLRQKLGIPAKLA